MLTVETLRNVDGESPTLVQSFNLRRVPPGRMDFVGSSRVLSDEVEHRREVRITGK